MTLKNSPSRKRTVFLSLVLSLIAVNLIAQQVGNDQIGKLTQQVESLAGSIGNLNAGDPEQSSFLKRLEAVKSSLAQLSQSQKATKELQLEIDAAESFSEQLTEDLRTLKNTKPKKLEPQALSLAKAIAAETVIEADLAQLRASITKLDARIADSKQNQTRIEQDLLVVDTELAAAKAAVEQTSQLGNTVDDRLTATQVSLNLALLQQRKYALRLQEQMEQAALQFDLVQKQRDVAAEKLNLQVTFAKQLGEAINQLRQEEAQEQASEAVEQATETQRQFPMLATSEQVNVELSAEITELENESSKAATSSRELGQQLIDLSDKFSDTRTRISAIGRSDTVGAMLRKRKADLPSVFERQQRAVSAHDRIEDIQFERFQTAESLSELSEEAIRTEIEDAGIEITDDQWKNLAEPVEKLISRRQEALRAKDKILDRLFTTYIETETTSSQIATTTGQFSEFINERIFWIRSNKLLFSEWEIDKADQSILGSSAWSKLAEPATQAVKKRSVFFILGGLLIIVLLALRPIMRRRVDMFSETAASGSCVTFWPTSRTAILTVLVSITVPLLVFGIGWGFGEIQVPGSRLFAAISGALMMTGLFAMPFEILRRICRPKGLATMHFDWPKTAVATLKYNLAWYIVPASLLVFAVSLFVRIDTAHRVDLLERTLFVAATLLTSWLLYRVFSPSKGIFSLYIQQNENSWISQTASLWFSAIVLSPIALGILTVAGYYFTALNLAYCFCLTFAAIVGVELVRALVRRFVLLRRRAAHIETAKRKRQAEIEAEQEKRKRAAAERQRRIEAGEDVDESEPPMVVAETLAELQVDYVDIDEHAGQANQLIRMLGWVGWLVALWLVWSDVLPAAKALDEYKLWGGSNTVAVSTQDGARTPLPMMPVSDDKPEADQEESGPNNASTDNGAAEVVTNEDVPQASSNAQTKSGPLFAFEPPDDDGVSLQDFLVFIAIVILTFVAARNLPNAFEMLFLEDLPVDRSARFASKALVSYAIIIFGTAMALRTLSINWTNIQWLVTALTFGLAFGLQEIFANFVAGIILMFERPMRIGDLITVDEFTGVVTRIRTRATTIVNRDRKEYIIPNKDFITGRLVNWTLSDAINRIQLVVGIAYGSDVAKAKRVIFDICADDPSIVEDPPTSITFEEFADSSLNLCVRTFLGEVDSRLVVIDALHTRIHTAFNEAGIEISFPQRDLNLRSIDSDTLQTFARIADASSRNSQES